MAASTRSRWLHWRAGAKLVALAVMPIVIVVSDASALEIRATVSAVEADNSVAITLPPGAAVAPGDAVRIEVEMEGIGPIAIATVWRITETGPGLARASPEGPPSGEPQAGYDAVIETSLKQQAALPPGGNVAPLEQIAPLEDEGIGACGRLAAVGDDPGVISGSVSDAALAGHVAEALAACREAASAEPGNARLSFQLARALAVAGNEAEAAQWMRTSAGLGHVAAMARLGTMLCSVCDAGPGPKDDTEAAGWFEKAAQAGHVIAMRNLARAHHKGLGVARDAQTAIDWYQRAADGGDAPSMTNLGAIYGAGAIVERDYGRAAGLFQRAADLGEVTAKFNLAMLYKYGAGVARDDGVAIQLFLAAAEAGDLRAAFQAARALDRGEGTASDPERATRHAMAALRGGYETARRSLIQQPETWSADFRRAVQRELHRLGLYDGAIDGIFGLGTRRAITGLAGD